mmetsp:Transcript_52258/g.102311  ORF Transcript_52258/g.102311 Transcript_52258/m.102311 type:complete len:99 (-) Transcript_52258:381-677(-)
MQTQPCRPIREFSSLFPLAVIQLREEGEMKQTTTRRTRIPTDHLNRDAEAQTIKRQKDSQGEKQNEHQGICFGSLSLRDFSVCPSVWLSVRLLICVSV